MEKFLTPVVDAAVDPVEVALALHDVLPVALADPVGQDREVEAFVMKALAASSRWSTAKGSPPPMETWTTPRRRHSGRDLSTLIEALRLLSRARCRTSCR